MSLSVSIMDVAKAAGFSKSTVSRVLNGKADGNRISHDAQSRILAVARQLGYQPDPIARNIALGKCGPQWLPLREPIVTLEQFAVGSPPSAAEPIPMPEIPCPTPAPVIEEIPTPVAVAEPTPPPQPEPTSVSMPVVEETPVVIPEPAIVTEPTPEPTPEVATESTPLPSQ